MSESKITAKKIWVHFSKAPYGQPTFKEGLDLSLVLGSFGNEMTLLFTDEAVWALVRGQSTHEKGPKIHTKGLQALALYDIEQVYVDQKSLTNRQLTPESLMINVELLNLQEMHKQLTPPDIILTY